ncbi:aldose 1-epimerase family protein [Spirosoma daeguense]
MSFKITTQPFGPLPTGSEPLTEYLLEHTETGEFITVIPGFGAILRRLVLRKGRSLFALIKAPDSPQALRADESYSSAILYPFPSRVHHGIYHFEGEDYALKLNEPSLDNAIHGFIHGRSFDVVEQEATDTYARITMRHDYAGDTVGYPFPFSFTITYELIQANLLPYGSNPEKDKMCALRVSYSVQNTGISRSPAAFGWHPYFMFIEDSEASAELVDNMIITLPGRTPVILNEKLIAVGEHPFEEAATIPLREQELNSAFRIEPTGVQANGESFAETILTSMKTGVRLIVGQQTGEGKLNYLVCYTPTRRNNIAIEPLTANVDAFNNGQGLTTLEPWESLSGTMWVRLD